MRQFPQRSHPARPKIKPRPGQRSSKTVGCSNKFAGCLLAVAGPATTPGPLFHSARPPIRCNKEAHAQAGKPGELLPTQLHGKVCGQCNLQLGELDDGLAGGGPGLGPVVESAASGRSCCISVPQREALHATRVAAQNICDLQQHAVSWEGMLITKHELADCVSRAASSPRYKLGTRACLVWQAEGSSGCAACGLQLRLQPGAGIGGRPLS